MNKMWSLKEWKTAQVLHELPKYLYIIGYQRKYFEAEFYYI